MKLYLEQSLALARISIIHVLLPLEERSLLNNIILVQSHEPSQHQTLGERLVKAEHLQKK